MTAQRRLSRHDRRRFLQFGAAAIAGGALLIPAAPAFAAEPEIYSDRRGLAIRGTDPVAYFTEGRPVKGDAAHSARWKGTEWRFSSAANRDAFLADPEAYAPQFGGYCAWAVSRDYTASIDPDAWRIVDGKLYLNYSIGVRNRWERDVPGNIARAEKNYPGLIGQ